MKRSIRQRFTKPKKSAPTACVHMDFNDNKMALMVEARLMAMKNAKVSTAYLNRINSSGVKLYDAASATEKADADKYAKELDQKMKDVQSGKCASQC